MVSIMVTAREMIWSWEADLRTELELARDLVGRKGAEESLAALIAEIGVGHARLRTEAGGGKNRSSLLGAAEAFLSVVAWTPALKRGFKKRIRERTKKCIGLIDSFEKGLELFPAEELILLASEVLFSRDWLSRTYAWTLDQGIVWAGLPKYDRFPFDDRFRAFLPDIDFLLGPLRTVIGRSEESPWIWWERAGCIPSSRIAAFLTGKVPGADAVRKHLADCPECSSVADSMALPRFSNIALKEALKRSHPSRESIERYKALNLSTPDWNIVDEHLRKCPVCASGLPGRIGAWSRAAIRKIKISMSEMLGSPGLVTESSGKSVMAWAASDSRTSRKPKGEGVAAKTLWKGKTSAASLRVSRGGVEVEVKLMKPGVLKVIHLENAHGKKVPHRRIPAPGKAKWVVSFAWTKSDLPILGRLSLPGEDKEHVIEIGE